MLQDHFPFWKQDFGVNEVVFHPPEHPFPASLSLLIIMIRTIFVFRVYSREVKEIEENLEGILQQEAWYGGVKLGPIQSNFIVIVIRVGQSRESFH